MKKIFKYILVLGIASSTVGCSDFLDTEPITQLTDGNYYSSPEDMETALVGCYSGLQLLYSSGGVAVPVAAEVMSDNCFGGVAHSDGFNYQVIDEFSLDVSPGEVNIFDANWVAFYKVIYRTNVLLSKIDDIDWTGNEAQRNSIESQARFIRAYCYFDMARLWERVPLLTEPTTGYVPQSDAVDIYSQITEDLLFAAENGSETVTAGRITKWAAKAYLARVYLFYSGYYGETELPGNNGNVNAALALQGLEDVIASGSYDLVSDFKNLWPAASTMPNEAGDGLETTYAGKDNIETVFSIKYNITSIYGDSERDPDGNHWLVMLGLREQSFSPYGRGWGACTVLPSLYNAYADGDTRRDASIIAISQEGLDFDNSNQREYTGYTNKKYTPISNPDGSDPAVANGGTDFQIGQYQDYVAVRYADVLLMAAELGAATAQDYLDAVRTRAGLTSVPATENNIRRERRLEFAFEGIRYWDLLRYGIDEAANAVNVSMTVQNGGEDATKTISGDNLRATRGLQMIPQNQITRVDGKYDQNAGWQ
ncbi:RagB/SusD family nutrient uptake outer membrane protein [Reichenbachiella ulvae]|uniref:RagB/SusD family nutrient uptake outer membrane protein n=1 Tax=Reichenbachiella ulvae TaxID=2980104 RepID=A0ABT3CPA0_9BACT|nr:RagB/SusD family nutrient uptake outer membrane protein [Reichenbachiella ulvae]MCV9385108.1 RagB/SusD family nutrient uptake outer membrane protein [Reichenbachiella ulvae]